MSIISAEYDPMVCGDTTHPGAMVVLRNDNTGETFKWWLTIRSFFTDSPPGYEEAAVQWRARLAEADLDVQGCWTLRYRGLIHE